MKEFDGYIYKIGINPVVDPPSMVLEAIFVEAGRSKGPVPVHGRLNGVEFIQTLVKFKGHWRLYINGYMLKNSDTKVGDKVLIEIEYDPRTRDVPIPKKLKAALRIDKAAKTAFDSLSPSRQKEILRYLSLLKTKESLARNIDRVLRHLRGEPAETLHSLMQKSKPKK